MFTLTCSSYQQEGPIPAKYTHTSIKGKNISPGFSWRDGPIGARSFAFSIIDPHPVAKNWVHWFVVDIPFNAREIGEGASNSDRMPKGARELMNTYGENGYGGPAPPVGTGPHPYVATLYALTVDRLDLPRAASLREFREGLAGKVLEEVSLTGYYEQK
jgi:Raf kinase inhibitor-like YbhB/YbcL family protein